MPSTKKVAPVRSVRAKKSVSAKKTARSSSVKVKVQKVRKNASSVRSVSIKDNSVKKNATDFQEKLQKFESLHSKKRSPQTKAAIKSVPLAHKILRSKHSAATALALLSPYRFPIDAEKLATATARYSGVFFVMIGACFTLLYADATLNSSSLQASVLSTSGLTERLEPALDTTLSIEASTQEVKVDCQSRDNFLHALCASLVDQRPHADISLPSEVVKESVQLKIKVPFAQSVTITAYNRTQKRELILGKASKVSDDTWEMYWPTSQYDDGDYKLKALIKNGYGSYEISDDAYVAVANAKLEDESSSSSTVETTAQNDVDAELSALETESTRDVALSIVGAAKGTEFSAEVVVKDAEKVKVYARKKLGTGQTLLGYAYKAGDALWKYRIVTKGVLQPGEYDVVAYALRSGREVGSNTASIAVVEEVSQLAELPKALSATSGPLTLSPEIGIKLDPSPLSGEHTITVSVQDAQSVELFLKPSNSLTQKYLGKAVRVDARVWLYTWDTSRTPNGAYTLFATVKNNYGVYTGQSAAFRVSNSVDTNYTPAQQESVDTLRTLQTAVSTTTVVTPLEALSAEGTEGPASDILRSYSESIDKDLQRLAAALRSNDPDALARANQRFEDLKVQVRTAIGDSLDQEAVQGLLDAYLNEAIERTKEDVRRIEKVVLERIGEEVTKDSDQDGISDFDELNIYGTDPFSADTDQDGFTDGAEILSGFDPLDPASETAVTFESPKERGVVREDILKVESVINASKNEDEQEDSTAVAILSGKGLPNSFVTLYVFSTPVVVTVKTDAEGNWTYRFDKELEDGTHEVYVGVTDNAGRLVAKSAPFTFVKEAEAFSAGATTQTPPAPIVVDRSMASEKMIYLVLSISVVAIGLVLIMLGLYLERRQRQPQFIQTEATV